ncbi:MAG: hypothetical protein LBV72_03545 [Tannerella sp.]|jgi:hypothetical protein|nr:hypothetical protein [Tannerella sp.]
MKPDLNKVLIAKIKEDMPSHIKLADYLMDLLSLSKESAYRRIRNQVSFTFEEVVKLAYENNFSIDELVKNENKSSSLNLYHNTLEHLQEMFLDMRHTYDEISRKLHKSKQTESINAIGYMNLSFVLNTDYMFRFMYFNWMHQFYGIPPAMPFSEFIISPEIIALKNKYVHKFRFYPSRINTVIFDQFTFLVSIRKITYYYRIGLITKEELFLLADEFHTIINRLQELAKNGIDEDGNKYFIYLSLLHIESNCGHMRSDDDLDVLVSFNNIYDHRIKNPMVCSMIEVWLNSLKRDSTLITGSAEWLQVKYFNKQHEYLNNANQ